MGRSGLWEVETSEVGLSVAGVRNRLHTTPGHTEGAPVRTEPVDDGHCSGHHKHRCDDLRDWRRNRTLGRPWGADSPSDRSLLNIIQAATNVTRTPQITNPTTQAMKPPSLGSKLCRT